ncbi:MAG: ABC transporter ATP-binding protein [Elusimicrobia bacterium]|nr:ABC transporter ATP-binding protein [Elusimicrobiota bacterium]
MSKIIEVQHLIKKFPMIKNQRAFKEIVVNLHRFSSKKNNEHFIALNSISFSVEKGECLGIIGKNGAGKSTLLSLLLGTSYPTEGELKIYGKRTPLLELGAGFHPDLTGRENIVLNGVLLGLTKEEVLARQEEIIQFSEITEFIDMPVRTYSAGMYMRLAFSVAICTDPEILLIDEILAVGDESFQKKSQGALIPLIKSGVTTVFVSHNLEEVKKICNRVLWLDHGNIMAEGAAPQVISQYLHKINP